MESGMRQELKRLPGASKVQLAHVHAVLSVVNIVRLCVELGICVFSCDTAIYPVL